MRSNMQHNFWRIGNGDKVHRLAGGDSLFGMGIIAKHVHTRGFGFSDLKFRTGSGIYANKTGYVAMGASFNLDRSPVQVSVGGLVSTLA
jgi:hypothetical protein